MLEIKPGLEKGHLNNQQVDVDRSPPNRVPQFKAWNNEIEFLLSAPHLPVPTPWGLGKVNEWNLFCSPPGSDPGNRQSIAHYSWKQENKQREADSPGFSCNRRW